jgi:hypothetical protein
MGTPNSKVMTRRRVLWVTLAVVAAAAGYYLQTRPKAALRAERSGSRGAWLRGGRPDPGGDQVRKLFEEKIPSYVIALDRLRGTGVQGAQAKRDTLEEIGKDVLSASSTALGPDATSFLRAVIEQANTIVTSKDFDPGADSHLRTVDAFNASIAALGLGYFLDAEVLADPSSGAHRVLMSTFTVERVAHYESGDVRVRALRLHRLDRLNFARAVLGFTREQVSDGLVLMERVEDYLVNIILPSFPEGRAMVLVDPQSATAPWVHKVQRAAAEDARQEAISLTRRSREVLLLGERLLQRRRLFARWREKLGQRGLRIVTPTTYDLDISGYARIRPRVPTADWEELQGIAAGLEEEGPRRAYADLESAFLESVERHEVQHRLDYELDEETLPDRLEALTGPAEFRGAENQRATRARAELSAYLAELARGPKVVKTNLALLSRFLLDRRSWGTAESYSTLVLFETMVHELGIEEEPLLVDRRIDREAVSQAYLAIREKDAEQIAEAAARSWSDLFGATFPPLRRRAP